jgi:hypothetical protein
MGLPVVNVKLESLATYADKKVFEWYNFSREVCTSALEKKSEKLSGPGKYKIVEIKSKFGKRKFHTGRRVDSVWVFRGGGIEI